MSTKCPLDLASQHPTTDEATACCSLQSLANDPQTQKRSLPTNMASTSRPSSAAEDDIEVISSPKRRNNPTSSKSKKNNCNNDSSSDGDASVQDSDDDDIVHLTKPIKSTGDVTLDIESLMPWVGSAILPKDGKKPKAAVMRFLIAPHDNHSQTQEKIALWDQTREDAMKKFKGQFVSADMKENGQGEDDGSPTSTTLPSTTTTSKPPTLKCSYSTQSMTKNLTASEPSPKTAIPIPTPRNGGTAPPTKLKIPVCVPPDDDELPEFNLRFSQLAGIIQFKNAVVLFVNLDKTSYANQFAYLHPDFGLSYYSSPAQTYQTGVIKKMLDSMPTPSASATASSTSNNNNNAKPKLLLFVRDDSAQAKKKPKAGSVAGTRDSDLLHVGEKYVFWGPVSIVRHGFVKDRGITQGSTAQQQDSSGKAKKLIQFLLKVDCFSSLLSQSWVFYDQVHHITTHQLDDTFNNDSITPADYDQ